MKKVLLVMLFIALVGLAFGYFTSIDAVRVVPGGYAPVAARINHNGVFTGFYTPHQFEPNTVWYGTYTVELENYGPWGPTSAYVAPEAEDGWIIFSSINGPTVPIELSSFTSSINADNNVNLTWITQSETGVRGYYILRNITDEIATSTTISGLIPATNTSQTMSYVFTDTELFEDGTYYYWLQNSDLDGHDYYYGPNSIYYSNPENSVPQPPQTTKLGPVYPNPFNPQTLIPFELSDDGQVSLKIYNNRGQAVKSFELGFLASGHHQVNWDGFTDGGSPLPSGIYHIRMQAEGKSYKTRAVLMK